MEKFTRTTISVLLALSVALFTGCSDSDIPDDDGDPENPTLFECVLKVIDDETSEPRTGQSVTITRTSMDGSVIHSTQDYITDASGEVAMNVRSGYYTAAVAFEPGKDKDNMYRFEIDYFTRNFSMRVEDKNPDIEPHTVVITLRDAKTGNIWGNKVFDLYSVTGAGDTEKIGTYTTDASGKYTTQLVAGRYRIAAAYFNNVSPLTNTETFQVKRDLPNTGELSIEPVHFADDFSWITPDWGTTSELRVWYLTLDPPAANSAAQYEIRWDLVVDEPYASIRDASGWSVVGTNPGAPNDRYTFFRPGIIKFGSASRGGNMTTPAFTNITGTATLKITFDSNPMHVVSNGAWAVADNGNPLKMKLRVVGPGYFKDTDGNPVSELVLDNPSGLQGGWPVDRWNKLEGIVYEAASNTQITIESNVVNGGSGNGCRSFIDNVEVIEIY